jgi:hypothetical protein
MNGDVSLQEQTRLQTLLQDAALAEEFSHSREASTASEAESSLSDGDWRQLDSTVKNFYHKYHQPFFAKPLFLISMASVVVLASVYSWWDNREPQHPALGTEGVAFGIEKAPALEEAPVPKAKRASKHEVHIEVVPVVFDQSETGHASVRIIGPSGKEVRSLFDGNLSQGKHRYEWDGLDEAGDKVAPGHYSIEINSYGGKETREVDIRAKK